MAGITVGGTTDDWILNSSTGLPLKRASKLRRYATLTGGSPLTLTLNGQSVTEIPVPPGGFYPEHTLPEGVSTTYVVALETANATDANFAAAPRYKEVPPGSGGGGGTSDYNALLNKPTLSTVAGTGAYADLTGKPTLAAVAGTGSYGDLSGKPTIPTTPGEVGAAAATHTHSATQISNSTTTGRNVLTAADKAAARAAIGLVTGSPAADEYQLLDTANVGLGAVQPPPAKGQFVMPSVTHGAQTPRAGTHYVPLYLTPGTYDALGCNVNVQQVGGSTTFKLALFKAHPLGLWDDSTGPLREATVDLTTGGTGQRTVTVTDLVVTEPGWYYVAALYAVTTAPTTSATLLCSQGTTGYSLPWTTITGNVPKTAYIYLSVTAWPTTTIAADGTVNASLTVNGNLNSPIVGVRRKAA
ncbi:hypothetical protein [Nocardioides aurantiacus]|uniref:Minor tail protein n=1 Tax=Nocardioides aurantiacus TaxID=86796 RepID=A0A3N2CW64_9ACTN|nr:hypothetical protein [Nocardioides aurantiacus]ROR91787.1 hypothetical protein EDD33_2662 [Nocardioides aurantiacus]